VPLFDLPLPELESYAPEIAIPTDLVPFWTDTLAEARRHDLALSRTPYENKLALIETDDLTFAGFGGTPVKAWLHRPAGVSGPLPTVVQYHGYSGGRGFPHASTIWAQAGYAHLVMDTRGQGWSAGGPSGTPDWAPTAGLNHTPGFMTSGITDPRDYYYRRVYTDAVRLLDAARALPEVDPDKIIVAGGSQGGGITVAAAALAALSGIQLVGSAPDVPFLCHFRRAVELTDRLPYGEISQYLAAWRDHADRAYATLAYFDGAVLGRLASAPTLFSVALMDPICPPSTVFAAYHAYGADAPDPVSDKEIRVYGHNGHEGGGPYQIDAQLDWFAARFAAANVSS
jgi:cephalosporin-C deacetylase